MNLINVFIKFIELLSAVAFWAIPVLAIFFKNINVLEYELLVASLEGLAYFLENKSFSKAKSFIGLFLFIASPIIFFIVH